MNEHISFEGNPETRSTVPVQFFDADGVDVPAGAKGTPRPVDRPRELPPAGPVLDGLQIFESQGQSTEGSKAMQQNVKRT